MSATYERLTVVDHTGRRTVANYRVESETATWIRATKVNREGEEVGSRYEADGTLVVTEYRIMTACVKRRVPLTMNLHYGCLEPTK